jgi:hypothetical protein
MTDDIDHLDDPNAVARATIAELDLRSAPVILAASRLVAEPLGTEQARVRTRELAEAAEQLLAVQAAEGDRIMVLSRQFAALFNAIYLANTGGKDPVAFLEDWTKNPAVQ